MLKVVLSQAALSKIFRAALENQNVEIAGFLLGRVENNCVIVVDGVWVRGKSERACVVLDFGSMAELTEKLEEVRSFIVGWWHSHPGIGADFMSITDVETQRVYQALFPHAIALIVDPMEYIKSGINRKSCSIYRVTSDGYESLPFDVSFKPGKSAFVRLRFARRHLTRLKKLFRWRRHFRGKRRGELVA